MSWIHINAGFIACAMGAVAAIAIAYALAVWDDRKAAPPVDDSVTRLKRWEHEPPAVPGRDPITAEIERWLAEGDKRRD